MEGFRPCFGLGWAVAKESGMFFSFFQGKGIEKLGEANYIVGG
jgi:hypothetical protein